MHRAPWAFYAAVTFLAVLSIGVGWAVWDYMAARKLLQALDRAGEIDPPLKGICGNRSLPSSDLPYTKSRSLPPAAAEVPLLARWVKESQQDLQARFTPEEVAEVRAHLSAHSELIVELQSNHVWSLGDSWDQGSVSAEMCIGRYSELLLMDAKLAAFEGRHVDAARSFKAALWLTDLAMFPPTRGGTDSRGLWIATRVISALRDSFAHLDWSGHDLFLLRMMMNPEVVRTSVLHRTYWQMDSAIERFHRLRDDPAYAAPWVFRSSVLQPVVKREFADHLDAWRQCWEALRLPYSEALSEANTVAAERAKAPDWFADNFRNPGTQAVSILSGLSALHVELVLARAAIDVELHRLRTGRLPDKLEDPPLDPISGRAIVYSPEAFWISSSTGQRWRLRRD